MDSELRANGGRRETRQTGQGCERTAAVPPTCMDRTDRDHRKFIMSLSEGEIIHARRNDRAQEIRDAIGYFVVVKLDKSRVYFAPHWDARGEKEQDRWDAAYSDLKDCEPIPGISPHKVRVDPLGNLTPLIRD